MENIPVADLNTCTVHPFKRISWSAIIGGALVGVGLGFLLNVFAIAIGLAAFSVSNEGALSLTVGGLLGLIVGIIVSMGAAGYTAGYLGRFCAPRRNLGIVYGFITWSLALILSAFLAAHLSEYITNYSEGITKAQIVTQGTDTTPEANSPQTGDNKRADNAAVPGIKAQPSDLAWGAFVVFILFFIGAFSSCVGACWGMTCRRED